MRKLLKVGITGGIGSGKSTVARIFESIGYAVYRADDRAKWLMNHDPQLIAEVKELFGEEAYDASGNLNRQLIGGIVFKQADMLAKLNAAVHPRTGKDFLDWVKEKEQSDYEKTFILKEAAILYESGAYKAADAVITVYAPQKLRLERVMARDGVTEEAVLDRMNRQWPDAEKIRRADFVIYNDEEHSLIRQVMEGVREIDAFQQKATSAQP